MPLKTYTRRDRYFSNEFSFVFLGEPKTDTDWLYRNKRGKTNVFFPVDSGDPHVDTRDCTTRPYLPPIFSVFLLNAMVGQKYGINDSIKLKHKH